MRNLCILYLFFWASAATLVAQVVDEHIKVDQFGYRPSASKVAIVANPIVGFNAGDSFAPGTNYEIRNAFDGSLAYTASIQAWKSGQTHDQSGDQVWWVDFSGLSTPGEYYVYDVQNDVRSHQFAIGEDVYQNVLRQALRSFYYQRCGTAKVNPYAESPWTDSACHLGALQDTDCRLATNPGDASSSRDLSGGWHDAGDYNKYVNFSYLPVHQLLHAYEENPAAFTDDLDIPESGNGVPDILDEVKWELDWLLKMQLPDGSVLTKVSVPQYEAASPPSADAAPRRYGEASSSSTRSFCSMMAHAATVFSASGDANMQAYGASLLVASQNAWNWLQNNTAYSYYGNAGFASANPEVSTYDQDAMLIGASAYLYAATGDSQYRSYFDSRYEEMHALQWNYWYTFESLYQDALLYYTKLPGASSNVVAAIEASITASTNGGNQEQLVSWNAETDAYRSFIESHHYGWGSNRVKSNNGNIMQNMLVYDIDAANAAAYADASEQYIHYMHGTNPLGLCMLTNMGAHNCENSLTEIYHGWFWDGTDYDSASTSLYGPAPGILSGGCNANFAPDPSYSGPVLDPPMNQPEQKSYRDWNTSWPENSWEVTENSITYQAAYIKLLSKFVGASDRLAVSARCLLEGPYVANGNMASALVSNDLLPEAQPFGLAPWNYAGLETSSNIPVTTIDWVLLEVWDSNNIVLERQAVLLEVDGGIKAVNGDSEIRFQLPASANYRLALRSRNHLDVVTPLQSDLNNSLIDFSDPVVVSGGAAQLKQSGDGSYYCRAGDFDASGVNSFMDFNSYLGDSSVILEYHNNDVNLDGHVSVADFNLYKGNYAAMSLSALRY